MFARLTRLLLSGGNCGTGAGKATAAAVAALLLLGLGACTTTGGTTGGGAGGGAEEGPAASSNGRTSDLPGALQHVRENPEDRSSAQVYCLLTTPSSDDDFPTDVFLAGLFDVPAEESMRVFCDAIVEAAIARELTDDDLAFLGTPPGERGLEPLGALLRKLMTAHQRLKSRQAESPGAAGPGASRPATSAS